MPARIFASLAGACLLSAASQPAMRLDYSSWLFVEVDGRATELTGDLLRDDRYAIDFGPQGFVGYGGCNRFVAEFTRSGNFLTPASFRATGRRCAEPVMAMERRLMEIMSEPFRISFPDRDKMIITGRAGTLRLRLTTEGEELPPE